MIVVAIPNTGTNRLRDLSPTHSTKNWAGDDSDAFAASGGGRKFEKFLAEELMPHIEGNYRTAPCRIFVGHSLGGLLAVDFFFQRPGLFYGCISIDPALSWDNEQPLREAREIISKSKEVRGNLYISKANNSAVKNASTHRWNTAFTNFNEFLRTNTTTGLRAKSDYYDAEDHNSVPFLSLYHGLLFIFDGFKLPLTEAFEDPMILPAHFKKASERLGYEFLPPEFTVNWLGYQFLRNEKKPDKALQCFQLNVKNYPNSGNAWDSLADIWQHKGDTAQAIENYERALKLSPNLKNAQNALKKLKETGE
jgi:predicted alpha/beta superfamily hydrolase